MPIDGSNLCFFKLVRGINLYIQTDGLLRCTLQAQSFGFVPSLARCPGLEPAGEGLGVVLEQDHSRYRGEDVYSDNDAFDETGGVGERACCSYRHIPYITHDPYLLLTCLLLLQTPIFKYIALEFPHCHQCATETAPRRRRRHLWP